MGRLSKLSENQKEELRMPLRKARYADLHRYVAGGIFTKSAARFFWEKMRFNFMKKHWAPKNLYYCIKHYDTVIFGYDECRVACR